MKKLLDVSIIALFTMVPAVGWAVPDRTTTGNTGGTFVSREYDNLNAAIENGNTYVNARSTIKESGLSDSETYREGNYDTVSIVTSQSPKYNVEQIKEKDGKDVASLSYVKGAYNDAITKINKVYNYKAETSNKVKLNTTWADKDKSRAVKKLSLTNINNISNGFACDEYYSSKHGNGQCDHLESTDWCAGWNPNGKDYYPAKRAERSYSASGGGWKIWDEAGEYCWHWNSDGSGGGTALVDLINPAFNGTACPEGYSAYSRSSYYCVENVPSGKCLKTTYNPNGYSAYDRRPGKGVTCDTFVLTSMGKTLHW